MTQTFGIYGGRYVPETLIPALDELTAGWCGCRARTPATGRSSTTCAPTMRAAPRRSRGPRASHPDVASTSSGRTCSTPAPTS